MENYFQVVYNSDQFTDPFWTSIFLEQLSDKNNYKFGQNMFL